jgi:hypothetical protein
MTIPSFFLIMGDLLLSYLGAIISFSGVLGFLYTGFFMTDFAG